MKLHERFPTEERERERGGKLRLRKKGGIVAEGGGEVARGKWNGATYQNDYLSLPFTLIDKSCCVNEWGWRGGPVSGGWGKGASI